MLLAEANEEYSVDGDVLARGSLATWALCLQRERRRPRSPPGRAKRDPIPSPGPGGKHGRARSSSSEALRSGLTIDGTATLRRNAPGQAGSGVQVQNVPRGVRGGCILCATQRPSHPVGPNLWPCWVVSK